MKLSKRVVLIGLFSLTAVLSLVASLGAITSYIFADQVLPRTLVAGVNVSNLTFPAAEQAITQRANELASLKVSFTLKDKSANATLTDLGVKVDPQSALSQVIRSNNALDWLRPSYWRAMFTPKEIAFGYQGDPSVVRATVEKALSITTAAKDASISYESGQLVVHEGQTGVSVSDLTVRQAITTVLATGAPTQTILAYTESKPIITTELANQTKAEVIQQLVPVQISLDDRTFTISPASEEAFLTFGAAGGKITWQVSTDKVKSYLNSAIAPKVNITMRPKTTMADTGQVTQEGVNGRQADLNKLASEIGQTITKRTDTTNSPLAIRTTTVPFTEKTIYPGYIAGLYPGLYLDVNLSTQHMSVLTGSTVMATYIVSTGQASLRTPTGVFYICNKIPLARSPLYRSLWMPRWNALSTSPNSCAGYVGYGIHRVPCFNASCTITESYSDLGKAKSHGCVRVEDIGADWIYDNAPAGTPVNIHT